MDKKVDIKISKILFDEIRRLVDKSKGEFKSVEEYVEFVLEELLRDENNVQVYNFNEEEVIKKRLKALGYIE